VKRKFLKDFAGTLKKSPCIKRKEQIMLTDAKTIRNYKLRGTDGEVGSIKEFLFDDKFWTIRYLVANTGSWLSRRQVLISPYFLMNIDHGSEVIEVSLTRNEIENSPSLDSDKPVSRQFEVEYYGYYGAPAYWGGPSMWGSVPSLTHDRGKCNTISSNEKSWDPNLRSSRDVTGHNIQATDDEIGKVDDFIIDDDSWSIRYLVIDTRKWLPGKKVLISPQWIERISWQDSKVFVNMTSNVLREAPDFDSDELLTRDYETRMYKYYNRQGYWIGESVTDDSSRSRNW
jgi:hypothetical protein